MLTSRQANLFQMHVSNVFVSASLLAKPCRNNTHENVSQKDTLVKVMWFSRSGSLTSVSLSSTQLILKWWYLFKQLRLRALAHLRAAPYVYPWQILGVLRIASLAHLSWLAGRPQMSLHRYWLCACMHLSTYIYIYIYIYTNADTSTVQERMRESYV